MDIKKIVVSLMALLLSNVIYANGWPEYKYFTTTGAGINIGVHTSTVGYKFSPDDVGLGALGGLGVLFKLNDQATVGFATRYIYNYIQGEVNPNIDCNSKYTNQVHDIVITGEGTYKFFNIKNFDLGVHSGLGINIYGMQLRAHNVGDFNANIDPQFRWREAFVLLVGLYGSQQLGSGELILGLDYFYLGNLKSAKKSVSGSASDLLQSVKFEKHDIIVSLSYLFGGK